MAENTVIQMYTTTTGDGAASIDIPDDGKLLRAVCQITGVLNADQETVGMQLSFGSTSQFNVNDARNVIAYCKSSMGLLTSGASQTTNFTYFDYEDGLPLFAGERLYLHTTAAGGTLSDARATLICRFKSFVARRR